MQLQRPVLSGLLGIFMDECKAPMREQVFSKSADSSGSKPYSIALANPTSVFQWQSTALARSVTLFELLRPPKVHHTFCGAPSII